MKKVFYRTVVCSVLGIAVFSKCHDAKAQVVVNEIHYNPANDLMGDANGDGVRSSSHDEFVEIVNSNPNSVDVSGYTISDADGVCFTVPSGTVLLSNQPLVVFGGGTPTGSFGGALVLTKSLGLNNADNYVVLKNATGATIDSVTYKTNSAVGKSFTRNPDITGEFGSNADLGTLLFTPGTKNDGAAFLRITDFVDNLTEYEFNIYPNPTTNIINVDGLEIQKASLISVSGEVVDLQISNQQLFIPNEILSGVYMLKITNNDKTYFSKLEILR